MAFFASKDGVGCAARRSSHTGLGERATTTADHLDQSEAAGEAGRKPSPKTPVAGAARSGALGKNGLPTASALISSALTDRTQHGVRMRRDRKGRDRREGAGAGQTCSPLDAVPPRGQARPAAARVGGAAQWRILACIAPRRQSRAAVGPLGSRRDPGDRSEHSSQPRPIVPAFPDAPHFL